MTRKRRLAGASETQPREIAITAARIAWLGKDVHAHKYMHGHALVVSGGAGASGAARLAARGALRIGAGLVTLAVPVDALGEVAAQITAIMMRPLRGASDLASILSDKRLTALCLGPGLGDRSRELVNIALADGEARPVVLDADALSAFSDAPQDLFARLHPACVLTPHSGEFARLFPDLVPPRGVEDRAERIAGLAAAAGAAARRAGCIVLLKGAETLIADSVGGVSFSDAAGARAAPWLATAGAGDVLAGFITGLLARGIPAPEAAELACWLHVECARQVGPGLISEDLPEILPVVLHRLNV